MKKKIFKYISAMLVILMMAAIFINGPTQTAYASENMTYVVNVTGGKADARAYYPGQTVKVSADPDDSTRGLKFSHWECSSSDVEILFNSDREITFTMPEHIVYVTAVFDQKTAYTVTYRIVNGTWEDGTTDDITETVYETFDNKEIPYFMKPAEGYTSIGSWDRTPYVTASSSTGDVTFTYTFTAPSSYNITYNLSGGTNDTDNPATYMSGTGVTSLKAATKAHYIFDGWYDNENLTGNAVTKIPDNKAGDITLYAKWIPESYTVTWKDVTGDNTISETASEYNTKPVFDKADPTKAADAQYSYTFAGWSTSPNSEAGTAMEDLPAVTGDITYYAAFSKTARTYSITYELNEGTNDSGNPDTYTFGTGVTSLVSPSREGYVFEGWYDKEDFTGEAVNCISSEQTGDITLYAKWIIKDAEAFVTRLYNVCLDRDPDEAGLKYWVNALTNSEKTGSQTAYGFIFSNEFKNKNLCNEHFVKYLYKALFGRDADSAGLKNWTDKLESGTTREEVLNGFIGSDEFADLCTDYEITKGSYIEVPKYGTVQKGACSVSECGKTDNVTSFVTRLYRACLERDPDDEGLTTWTNALWNHTKSGSDVAYGFIFSSEFTNKNLSDEDFVTLLYKAFFDRTPDTSGFNNWTGKLRSGTSRLSVFKGFTGSQEFINLCNKYGITR